jgi:hypothetical protein
VAKKGKGRRGDKPGHPFRGNQYTKGGGRTFGFGKKAAARRAYNRASGTMSKIPSMRKRQGQFTTSPKKITGKRPKKLKIRLKP